MPKKISLLGYSCFMTPLLPLPPFFISPLPASRSVLFCYPCFLSISCYSASHLSLLVGPPKVSFLCTTPSSFRSLWLPLKTLASQLSATSSSSSSAQSGPTSPRRPWPCKLGLRSRRSATSSSPSLSPSRTTVRPLFDPSFFRLRDRPARVWRPLGTV